MNRYLLCALVGACAFSAAGEVRIAVEDINGAAWIKYECTAGEVVRSFALDVSVEAGKIVGISDFFRGECRVDNKGYGIFPASVRDFITVQAGTEPDWNVPGYTPLAVLTDAPADTLPGLGSHGVTLEFGALWNSNDTEAAPASSGFLCALQLSSPARVSIAANKIRGGVVTVNSGAVKPVFIGAPVGPAITSVTLGDGFVSITFQGGELQAADALDGEWVDTGASSGVYTEPVEEKPVHFYRVRARVEL